MGDVAGWLLPMAGPRWQARARSATLNGVIQPQDIAPEKLRPLRRAEYERLVELGFLGDERVELIHGALVEMSPQGARHAEVIRRLNRMLVRGVGDRAIVQVQAPLAVSEESEPEPDVAVLAPGDYSRSHPRTALLVVEVAESSARKDRLVKSDLYAAAGIPEYWLVDLEGEAVEVRTDPVQGRYTRLTTHTSGTLRPAQLPDIAVAVSDLLP